MVNSLPDNGEDAGDAGLASELGRSPGGGNGNALQYSCLKNAMDRGASQAIVHGVTLRASNYKLLYKSINLCQYCVHISTKLAFKS